MERDHFILNAKSILLILFLVSSGCATTKNQPNDFNPEDPYETVSYTHLRAHETV